MQIRCIEGRWWGSNNIGEDSLIIAARSDLKGIAVFFSQKQSALLSGSAGTRHSNRLNTALHVAVQLAFSSTGMKRMYLGW